MSNYPIYTIEKKDHSLKINEGTTRNHICVQQAGKVKEFLSESEAKAFWNEIKDNIFARDEWILCKLDKIEVCDL